MLVKGLVMEKYTELKNQRLSLKDAIPLNTPFTLFVDPTNWCNFKCSFCPRNQSDFEQYAGKFTHMSLQLFKKIAQDLHAFPNKLKVLRLFYLGEPLLCPDFLPILRTAAEENLAERIEISTNASLLSEKIACGILDIARQYSANIYLRISIYSVIQEKFEKITLSPISIDDIYHNVAVFHKQKQIRGGTVRVYAKMLESYDDESRLFLETYRPIVDEVELEEPMEWSGYGKQDLLADVYSKEVIAKLNAKKMPKACAYPFHTLAIQSDGKVVCCCVDWSRHTLVGDVTKESLLDIWNGAALRNLRILHLSGKRYDNEACRNCLKLPCGGSYDMDNLDDVSPEVLNTKYDR